MNRRGFLKLLAGAGAATAVTHFLPPIGGWHSDVIAQPEPQSFNINGLKYIVSPSNSLEYAGISRDPQRLSTPLFIESAPPLTREALDMVIRKMDRRAQGILDQAADAFYCHPAEAAQLKQLMKKPSLLDRLFEAYAA